MMPISVHNNPSSALCQKALRDATKKMNQSLERLSTGFKINSAKDNCANYSIAKNMTAEQSSYSVARDNTNIGLSMLTTASGGLSLLYENLSRLRALAVQAANGTYGGASRDAMQLEADALTDELYRIKNSIEFDGKNLLGEENNTFVHPTISISEIDDLSKVSNSEIIGISTAEELQKLGTLVDAGQSTYGKTFVLTNDIDLSSIENFNPIGDHTGKYFRGTFEGNGCTISNLNINATVDRVGLFSTLASGSIVKNVMVENATVKANRDYVGILAGSSYAQVTNCYVEGEISAARYYAGGLIGELAKASVVKNCSADINVASSSSYTGGLIGYQYGTVIDSYAIGTVNGYSRRGGLTGYLNGGKIIDSWTDVKLSGTSATVGALVGQTTGSFTLENNRYNSERNSGLAAVGTGLTPTNDQIRDGGKNLRNSQKSDKEVSLQVGIRNENSSVIKFDTEFKLGTFGISLMNETSSRMAIDKIDSLIDKLNNQQVKLGATMNRLDSVINYQTTQISTLANNKSVLEDVDFAEESSAYINAQILQSASATLLATANQTPSLVLQLLQGGGFGR